MKRLPILARALLYIVGTITALALLYILSYAPAGRWVAGTLAGREATPENIARYDARFSGFVHFYEPLLEVRQQLIWRANIIWPENAYYDFYEKHFMRSARLADGRRVFTTHASLLRKPGETIEDFLHACGAPDPKPGFELHSLPLAGRALVILAPSEDPLVDMVLRPSWESDLTWNAGLQHDEARGALPQNADNPAGNPQTPFSPAPGVPTF